MVSLAFGRKKQCPPPNSKSEELLHRADELLDRAGKTTERLRKATDIYIERERGSQRTKPKRK